MDQLTGGCLCGAIQIVTSGSPNRVGICHRLDCRKHSGTLFYAAAIFPEDAVTIEGKHAITMDGISARSAGRQCSPALQTRQKCTSGP
jgi:hypothetical protein